MDELLGPFEQMLASVADRKIDPDVQWKAIEDSGYLDALVPEESGGAGLSLSDVEPLIRALGRFAISSPVAEVMAKRGLGVDVLDRPLAAILAVAEMAGLAEKILEMSLSYANDRVQFGKPIGKLQVIQQQLAVMGRTSADGPHGFADRVQARADAVAGNRGRCQTGRELCRSANRVNCACSAWCYRDY